MLKQELAILREHIEVTLPELSCKQQILRNTSGHWHGKRHIIFLKHPFIERYQMILWYQLATVARWIFAMQMVSKRCRRQRHGGFPWMKSWWPCHGHHDGHAMAIMYHGSGTWRKPLEEPVTAQAIEVHRAAWRWSWCQLHSQNESNHILYSFTLSLVLKRSVNLFGTSSCKTSFRVFVSSCLLLYFLFCFLPSWINSDPVPRSGTLGSKCEETKLGQWGIRGQGPQMERSNTNGFRDV